MVGDVQRAITADANARLRRARSRPLRSRAPSCSPTRTTRRADQPPGKDGPRHAAGALRIVAYNNKLPLSELEGKKRTGLFGYIFYAVIGYRTGSYAFCKISPRAGEGGASLAFVTVPRACRP